MTQELEAAQQRNITIDSNQPPKQIIDNIVDKLSIIDENQRKYQTISSISERSADLKKNEPLSSNIIKDYATLHKHVKNSEKNLHNQSEQLIKIGIQAIQELKEDKSVALFRLLRNCANTRNNEGVNMLLANKDMLKIFNAIKIKPKITDLEILAKIEHPNAKKLYADLSKLPQPDSTQKMMQLPPITNPSPTPSLSPPVPSSFPSMTANSPTASPLIPPSQNPLRKPQIIATPDNNPPPAPDSSIRPKF